MRKDEVWISSVPAFLIKKYLLRHFVTPAAKCVILSHLKKSPKKHLTQHHSVLYSQSEKKSHKNNMKSSISRDEIKEEELVYPVLMQCVSDDNAEGIVVLFSGLKDGVAVHSPESCPWDVGHYSEAWIPCDNRNEWQKFTGKITLSN